MTSYSRNGLRSFTRQHDSLVGIDSDGCVFDSMEIKQKRCFHGEIIDQWGLQEIAPHVRQVAEFVNLYSTWRGSNRFVALLKMFELLEEWDVIQSSGVHLPDLSALRDYVNSGLPLSNDTLKAEAEKSGHEELHRVYAWSCAVNDRVERVVKEVPLFRGVRETLDKMKAQSDLIVVSQTPTEALAREWEQHGLREYVHLLAGQELGTKNDHLQWATTDRYPLHRVLLIGDAPGDRKAAQAVNTFFYPINPGHEEASWKRLHDEAYDRFITGEFDAAYQEALIKEFEVLLPEIPPWQSL